jgi:predicted DNA-binding protein (UPF0251 family)
LKQREDAAEALRLLEEAELSLTEAARIALKYFKPIQQKICVSEAIKEMLKIKEAENLRPRSIRDLKNRMAQFEITFGDSLVHEILVEVT